MVERKAVNSLRSQKIKELWQRQSYHDAQRNARIGKKQSEETKRLISQAMQGKRHTEEYRNKVSRERGGVRIRALPLLLRGGSVEEVVQITGLRHEQVSNFITDARRSGILPRPTKEQESEAKRRAHLGRPKRGHGRKYEESQRKQFAFIGKLLEADLIPQYLTNWEALGRFYQKGNRTLPDSFAERLRLEVFFVGCGLKEIKGRTDVLDTYNRVGNSIDTVWFLSSLNEHERYITSRIQFVIEEKREQAKWSTLHVNGDAEVVFDNQQLAKRRAQIREWKPPAIPRKRGRMPQS